MNTWSFVDYIAQHADRDIISRNLKIIRRIQSSKSPSNATCEPHCMTVSLSVSQLSLADRMTLPTFVQVGARAHSGEFCANENDKSGNEAHTRLEYVRNLTPKKISLVE